MKLNEFSSNWLSGVPQGSVNSTLLFSLYTKKLDVNPYGTFINCDIP